ncbi:MAG: carboxypeptidase M32 [Caldilineae bacterium]|nr:MAG: carboxypeptidase M32 [Caldilineae bacterium]
MEQKLNRLKTLLAEIADLRRAMAVLGWDQETYMPPGGVEARAEQVATLSKIAHQKFTADEVGQLLDDLADHVQTLPPDSDDAALVRVIRRDYRKARKLPASLVAELSRTTSRAVEAWKQARADDNFAHFRPHLEKVVALTIQKAEAYGYEEHIYDPLLDDYEPEMKSSQVEAIFNQVRDATVPLVQAIMERGRPVDNTILHQAYDPQKQWDFGVAVIKDYGFDFQRGRQDKSAHPFTTSFSTNDVRLTTRIMEHYLPAALFGTLHEAGHGLYEQGFAESLNRTGLDEAASLAVHESQSRLWENIIGRSKPFWQHYYPRLQEMFPEQLGQTDLETFYRAINKVQPSIIRVEADEVTYNLHIFLRFEIERMLVTEAVRVADLPDLWNDRMQAYLGVTPPSDAFGVLQDIHWSGGSIGYFPTYALGNILSVQFYNRMLQDDPTIPDQIAQGKFDGVLGWLRTHIHRHGRKFTPTELVERVTGGPMDARPYIEYITGKYSEIYEL